MNQRQKLTPDDEFNKELVNNVFPDNWVNPEPALCYNLVVIGAGTGGLVTAAGAAGLGAKVALVERHLFGGDCLNYGCVPSKTIIHSSRVASDIKNCELFGIQLKESASVNFTSVMERMRRIRAKISYHDAVKRFADMGVDIFLGNASFISFNQVTVKGLDLKFKKAVIATGARAHRPPIDGLDKTGFLTNETVFSLNRLPARLAIIGAGPIGCEMAQAFRRLGSDVILFSKDDHILPREDPDAAGIVQKHFINDGVTLIHNAVLKKIEKKDNAKVITYEHHGNTHQVEIEEILVSAGRLANVENMGLEKAGVDYDTVKGVVVNDKLQTTHPKIFAVGDCCMTYKFTHAADFAARIVIQNALFKGRKKLSSLMIPWCTYTDPEIAHVGISEKDAEKQHIRIDTFIKHFYDVDRAIAEGEEDGFVKIHVKKGTDKILGATIVARHAGEMISEITLAITHNIGLGAVANVIHPYPTQAEAIRQTGDLYNKTRLTPFIKKLFNTWLRWTR